jgi:hypothetical protein
MLADGLAEGEAAGLAGAEALVETLGVGEGEGRNAISGRALLFGLAAKNRGGRLKVGTSSQKGACGSSAKYRLAAGSAALPLVSMRKGPISQSEGIARTTKKSATMPALKSRKPSLRRRRGSAGCSSSGVFVPGRNGIRILRHTLSPSDYSACFARRLAGRGR